MQLNRILNNYNYISIKNYGPFNEARALIVRTCSDLLQRPDISAINYISNRKAYDLAVFDSTVFGDIYLNIIRTRKEI